MEAARRATGLTPETPGRAAGLSFVPFPDETPETGMRSKSQLALAYGVDPKTFSRYLKRFEKKLAAAGYRRTDKLLSPRLVRLVHELLGEP